MINATGRLRIAILACAQAFADIDFMSGYWQPPIHSHSPHVHEFMTADGVLKSTITSQDGCNNDKKFQACAEPSFGDLRENGVY